MVTSIEDETLILDTYCKNHMIRNNNLLSSLDHSFTSSIKPRDESTL